MVLVDMEEGFRVMSVVAGERAPLGARVTVSVEVPQDVATEARLLTVLGGASRG